MKNYVKRNVSDSSIQAMSVQEEQTSNQNPTEATFHKIMPTVGTMYKVFNIRNQLGGQRTGSLGKNLHGICNVVAKRLTRAFAIWIKIKPGVWLEVKEKLGQMLEIRDLN